jgi:glyoxylase-like metal-dependent hydrolase (beta-lactamase superfamily II)
MSIIVKTFFDRETHNATHLVCDGESGNCAVIDPVLGLDLAAGRTGTSAADRVVEHVSGAGLTVDWILETHVHADHLTAAQYIKEKLGGQIAIGEHVTDVQKYFAPVFNLGDSFAMDGSQFDHLFVDGEIFRIGGLEARVLYTPGHTPACVTYVIGDAVFTGDTLFRPDSGTARCDFPGGSARQLYASLQKILSLPPATRMFVNHDYGADGQRDCAWETTVAAQKAGNIHVGMATGAEDEYVAMRHARDATLAVPKLLLPALQVNINAGVPPYAAPNGTRYLQIPLTRF